MKLLDCIKKKKQQTHTHKPPDIEIKLFLTIFYFFLTLKGIQRIANEPKLEFSLGKIEFCLLGVAVCAYMHV